MRALQGFASAGNEASETLRAALQDREPRVRALAAQALGFIGSTDAIADLDKTVVEDNDAAVRLYAVQARGRLGGIAADPAFSRVSRTDPSWNVRDELSLALKRPAERAPASLQTQLAEFDVAQIDSARVGELAPDFELSELDRGVYRLSDFRGKKNVVLIFTFNSTCMFCRMQVRDYLNQQFADLDAQVIVVEGRERFAVYGGWEEVRIDPERNMLYLCDPAFVAAAKYGVAFQTTDHVELLNRPATFLIDRAGIIRSVHRSENLADRKASASLLGELKQLQATAKDNATDSRGELEGG